MKWEEIKFAPGFAKQNKNGVALVQKIGSSWGYTIWREGRCVAGACNWDWDAFQAQAEADKAMDALTVAAG